LKDRVSIGLLGFGFMGRTHTYALKNIPLYFESPQVEIDLVAACEIVDERARYAHERVGYKWVTKNWKEVTKSDQVEVVDNCLPNYLHCEPIIDAIENGKDVVCEKPLACDLKQAEEMMKAAKKQNVKNMIVFNYRFIPALILAKKLIDDGFLGRIFHFRGVYGHSRLVDPKGAHWISTNKEEEIEWRLKNMYSGGGALTDLGAHLIDLARYFVGSVSDLVAVTNTFIKERPKPRGGFETVDVDDAGSILLRFQNGANGVIEASRLATGMIDELRFEIQGSKGALRFNLMDFNTLELFSREDDKRIQGFRRITVDAPPPASWPPPKSTKGWTRAHVGILHHFIDCVVNDRKPKPDFEDGVEIQRILAAAYVSSRERKWVNLA